MTRPSEAAIQAAELVLIRENPFGTPREMTERMVRAAYRVDFGDEEDES